MRILRIKVLVGCRNLENFNRQNDYSLREQIPKLLMLAFRCISSVSKGKIFSGHNFRRRSYASSAKDRSFGNAMQAVPITSASGKPSFRPKKLPPGRKRIPEQFLLPPEAPRASSARQLPRESSIDEEKEHAEVSFMSLPRKQRFSS